MTAMPRLIELVSSHSGKRGLGPDSQIDQIIIGDDADEFLEALANTYREHIFDWPWDRFLDFSEPHGLRWLAPIWRWFGWDPDMAFPKKKVEALTIGQLARTIDGSRWIEP